MLFSDTDIKKAIESGEINVSPYEKSHIQPASLDIRLGNSFCLFNNHKYGFIDPKERQEGLSEIIEIEDGAEFVLHPGEFVLATTYERVRLGDLVAARLEGKSSLGRLGLLTHSTAGFIDPGFEGEITLELSNMANLPLKLYPKMKIGQLCFFKLLSKCNTPYGYFSKYQGQKGATPSKSYKNF